MMGVLYIRPVYDFQGPFAEFTLQQVIDLMDELNAYPYPALQPTDPFYTAIDPAYPGSWDQMGMEFDLEPAAKLAIIANAEPTIFEEAH